MVVLWNISWPVSRPLFLSAKTGGGSKFELGNAETTAVAIESADLTAVLRLHDGHHRVERDVVALVANATHRHQRSRDCGDLEYGLDVPTYPSVAQVERALAEVRYDTSVAHEEFLASSAPWGLANLVPWDVLDRADVHH